MQDDNGKLKAKDVTGPHGAKIVATRPQGDGEPRRERSKGPLGRKREERTEPQPENNSASQTWGGSTPAHNPTAQNTTGGWSANNLTSQPVLANTTNTGFGGWGK